MRLTFLFTFVPLILFSGCRTDHNNRSISSEKIQSAQSLFDLEFTKEEIDTMVTTLERCLTGYQKMRKNPLDHQVPPSFRFDPRPEGFITTKGNSVFEHGPLPQVSLPDDMDHVAFYSIPQLAYLLRSGQITSRKLTDLYLERLDRYDSQTEAVITFTRESAYQQADRADAEFASGIDRSILQGIPYGMKDLVSLPGYPTSWGAAPFKDQILPDTAEIIRRLENSGAVLIAKLSSGELASGDVWFGGKTKNPWDLEQGARGSSAGSGAATAAGLVGFAIGTETWGSILSPSSRCGVTGLRPTYGRVSRYGIMTLAWTLDKVGPMCRTAEGCAYVFETIIGKDAKDHATVDFPVQYDAELNLSQVRAGFLETPFKNDTTDAGKNGLKAIELLKTKGLNMKPAKLPNKLPWSELMYYVIRSEASSIFDELISKNEDDLLKRQTKYSRANSIRAGEFIPAVAYIQANRYRTILISQMDSIFQKIDVLIALPRGSDQSAITNLTGHPAISIPSGFDEKGRPTSIVLIGKLYDEGTILAIAKQFQELTSFEGQIPPGYLSD